MNKRWTTTFLVAVLLAACAVPAAAQLATRPAKPGAHAMAQSRNQSAKDTPPYLNPAVPLAKRVDDLVARMTLQEKVSQMMNGAGAIERLGIPKYEWWNEALHGVARAGIATVFPQAIGLGATWDEPLINRVADVISTEARAKHNDAVRKQEFGRYQGLTFWSPNINIFRDPRWGRGQETYGEDPYLTSRLGVAFVKGLQGSDPRYLKVVATPKHYAVHSGPEPERHGFDANADQRDMLETYLPAFRATIMEARAASLMCAYNRTNGEPCCANKSLLNDILRTQWGFKGYIVSDCGAIDDIYRGHHFADSVMKASVVAVRAGTDLSCGAEYETLVQAVKDGLIAESEIDVSVKRLMLARFQLGMFDPPELVAYARIPISENDTAAHRELALKTAQESIVLLKNELNTLPLKKNPGTIAVIGPNADAPELLLGNYFGQPSRSVTPLAGIKAKVSADTKVLYALGVYRTGVSTEPIPASAFRELKGEYFANRELSGPPALVRDDAALNFYWGAFSPVPELPRDNFSVRWTGKLLPAFSATYTIGIAGNGGMRFSLDGKLVFEELTNRRTRTITRQVSLEAGHSYDIRVEYFENANSYAGARLVWSNESVRAALKQDALQKAQQADVIVMALGISPDVEGEEMDVNIPGFRGGDRTDLELPQAQQELLQEIQALGKPVVLVLLNGSALAVNWASEHVSAIVEAWYPGEEGGTALADVLFGDYNPGGRLPVTFYKSVTQLPPFDDYKMAGRTYRYFKDQPLYPFGYGLSYTTFRYSNLRFNRATLKAGAPVTVSADVQNTGTRAGDEVVQLYVTDAAASVPVPIRSLIGINRIVLKPGEIHRVTFRINPVQLSVVYDNGQRMVEPGEFQISIGGKQPGFAGPADAATTEVVSGKLVVTGQAARVQ